MRNEKESRKDFENDCYEIGFIHSISLWSMLANVSNTQYIWSWIVPTKEMSHGAKADPSVHTHSAS